MIEEEVGREDSSPLLPRRGKAESSLNDELDIIYQWIPSMLHNRDSVETKVKFNVDNRYFSKIKCIYLFLIYAIILEYTS